MSGSSDFVPMRSLAPAKINLGLFVGGKRKDGKHELVSVMQAITIADEVTLECAKGIAEDELVCPGVQGPDSQNLAMRALTAFRDETGWDGGPVRITVSKRVPVAAGLGGGSADAAAVLRLVAAASKLEDGALLLQIAKKLGADVPAQVSPGRWLARGAGERLSALPEASAPFGVLVLPAREPLSTASVYAELDRVGSLRSSKELDRLATTVKRALAHGEPLPPLEMLANDLESPALALCPAIGPALERMRSTDADVVMLSGSGPTVLGLFGGEHGVARAQRAAARLGSEGILAHVAEPLQAGGVAPRDRAG